MRFGAVCLAVLLAAPASIPASIPASMPAFAAKELKPKFGDIDGPYYTEVSENREACRAAIRNSIALCRQNVAFESNTKNRKYAGCLPIFRQQAESCVVHFRHQMSKCELSGAVRITSYSGFSCTPTKTVVEEGGDPGVTPADRRMKARTQSNVRAGPGTGFRIVGSLRTGEDVHVTGEAGDWLRIEGTAGTAFVHRSLLVQSQAGRPARTKKSSGPGWMVAENQLCEVWNPNPEPNETVTWSGDCVEGKTSGAGRLVWRSGKETTTVFEGEYRNGKPHGRGTFTFSPGDRYEGEYRNGKRHGRWTWTGTNGKCHEVRHFDNGKFLSSKKC
ncbi:MAG: SH3 domain-containing protein [Rhodospirillaceae bacterium]|nr:SH3 domain-containing protein [Rhodospirillaceae bacterium]